jgi:hypothetical protein
MLTTILAMALTTQAAKAQAPTSEQKRQAELKALAAKIHQESLAKKPTAKPKTATPKAEPVPVYRYLDVPEVEERSLLYLWDEGLSRVPLCTNPYQVQLLQKSMLDDDQTHIDEFAAKWRLPCVPIGMAVKVIRVPAPPPSISLSTRTFARELQNAQSSNAPLPACEVRILDGPFKDRQGWVLEHLLRERVLVAPTRKRK